MEILDFVRNSYSVFEQLGLSVTALITIAVIVSLAFLFAVREVATWFFKIDDLKRDIVLLREVATQLEGEIRALNTQLQVVAPPPGQAGAGTAPIKRPLTAAENVNFPIVH